MNSKKWIVAVAVFACWTVQATPVSVDFSVLGSNTVDITTVLNPSGYTIGDVTFRYDDLGSGVDFASVDQYGILGTTFGSLLFDFNTPVTSLKFDFSVLNVTGQVSNGLFISFLSGGVEVSNLLVAATNFVPYDPVNPTLGGDALGSLAFNGIPFDQVAMYFSLDGPYFDVANIVYELEPMPQLAIAEVNRNGQQVLMLTATGPSGSVTEIQSTINQGSTNWTSMVVVTNFTGSYTTYVTSSLPDAPQACYYRTAKTR
ncbi:MAG: hypothetical protein WCL16_04655 [bacterium]